MNKKHADRSLSEVHSTVETNVKGGAFRRLLAFIGPAYLVSVGYMDPGNWATDLAGGSRFGYALLWVLVMSNLIALLMQSLSARLGVVAGRDLAQASRELYPRPVNLFNYLLAEIAIAATDLAEVLGMAIGLQLLFDLPLVWGVAISVLDAFLLLLLMQLGIRKLEAFILTLIGIIGIAFAIQMVLAKPLASEMASGLLPSIPDGEALFIAIGIIGATVMPHNLYLHSALVQTRKIDNSFQGLRQAIRYNIVDSAIALNLALFVNAAILILAAAVFHKNGYSGVSEIRDAHQLLEPLLGESYAPVLFAIALIAAGQSSTVTGTLAGQIVMEGYLYLRIAPWLRRILTRLLAVVPAIVAITVLGEDTAGNLLVLSQVILSMQLGFAIVPLLHYVSSRERMGAFAIGPWTKLAGWTSASVIVALNIWLVVQEVHGWLVSAPEYAGWIRWGVVPSLLFAAGMLVYIVAAPWVRTGHRRPRTILPHRAFSSIGDMPPAHYPNIAVALDFTDTDAKTLHHALQIGGKNAHYLLLHVVESAGAWAMGDQIRDMETFEDQKILDQYADHLRQLGYTCDVVIGFGKARQELPRLIEHRSVALLVMGAHGHRTLKDFIFGATIDAVRHAVRVPVFVVQ